MNLRSFQSVFGIRLLLLVFGFNQIKSTTADEEYCGFSDIDEDMCSTYCYKAIKAPLSYILELKEQIKAKAEEQIDTDNEIRELRKRLVDLTDYRNHIKSLNDHIEELRKTNEILRESVKIKNNCGKTEDLKVTAKDLSECMADQDKLKKEIEIERKNRIKIEEKFKSDISNLNRENERIINELETKSKKDFADHKDKEESLSNESKDLKSEVSSYKEQLKESQNQLTANNQLTESNSRKIKKLEKDLVECKGKIPKTGCKGLSSGIHTITIPNLNPFPALCNGDISCGGWTVIQKRFDGSEDFYRNWTEYRNGFGKLDGEFFIGLENLHRITNSQRYELYIEMKKFEGEVMFVRYDNFRIGNEIEKYKLQSIGNFSGTTTDYLQWHVGAKFSTYDQDNDGDEALDFAKHYHGGWWYNSNYGAFTNLNGRYYKRGFNYADVMHWDKPLKSVQMLIRPKSK